MNWILSRRANSFSGIYARAEGRTIEIELEPISQRATRIRVATRNGGFFHDSATAEEIVAQTAKML